MSVNCEKSNELLLNEEITAVTSTTHTKLVMAAHMAAEKGMTIDLTETAVQQELETYIPLIQQGRGAEVLQLM